MDDTIHLISVFCRTIKDPTSLSRRLTTTLRYSGEAIIMTTVIISIGFTALLFSRFDAIFLTGFLTIITMFAALWADLYLFTALMYLVKGKTPEASA